MKIQLVYHSDCPHVEAARENLLRALESCGCAADFDAIDASSPEAPLGLRDWGSPTILIDGQDAGGAAEPTGPSCRLYPDRAPSQAAIRSAIEHSRRKRGRG